MVDDESSNDIIRWTDGGKHFIIMDINEFVQFVRKAPTLLSVAFTIQAKLQAEVCGVGFWKKISDQRRNKHTIFGHEVDFGDIDAVIEIFEQVHPEVLADKRSRKERFNKQREADGSRLSGDQKKMSRSSKYALANGKGGAASVGVQRRRRSSTKRSSGEWCT